MGITAGFGEELIFQGYIQPRLEYITNNKWVGILLSAFFFAIAHFANSDIFKMVFIFINGIVFSLHYYKYNNIFSLGLAHCLTDIVPIL